MRLVPTLALAAILLSAAAARPSGAGQSSSGPQPSFRAGIDLVSLTVTVTTPENRYVTDLAQGDFTVFEDGVKQDITFFTRTRVPIALALLIDTSASMEDKLTTAQEAAIGFARRIRTDDLGEVIEFDSRVEVLQKFTNDISKLEQAIRQTSAGGSTSLHNAVYISLKELRTMKARSTDEIRRQAIVVLSDGEDTSSLVPFEEVLDLAKRSETAIYAIGLRSRESTTSRGFKEAEFVLKQLANETGGRAFFPERVSDLNSIYGQIAEELASQYTLGYMPKNPRRDGVWRRVVVRIERPNAMPRTKQGYYAPLSAGASP
jgi:Ca-activated chloride channel family protein